jgi:pimeloyl-ACP methyl ester carboxylesterase
MKKLSLTPKTKKILVGIAIFVAIYTGVGISLKFWQTRLIFFPPSEITRTPKDIGINYQEVWISVDGQKINAWWIPARQADRPVLLYLHGNGSNLSDLVEEIATFHRMNLAVLAIDYRGYGASEGDFPTEKSVYEDARAAWYYLTSDRQIPEGRIFLYGHSLGGAIAIDLAGRFPRMGGAIIEGSFTSISEMIDYRIPVSLYPKALLLTQQFNSLDKIRSIRVPLLFIHGKLDRVVPAFMSQKLYKASVSPKRSLRLVPDAGHDNLGQKGGEVYRQAILTFIDNAEKK